MRNPSGVSLPQLPGEIVRNARKTRLDAFAVAVEGWRRGLKLKWYTKDSEHYKDMIIFGVNPPGRLFSLSSDQRTHYFFRTRGDKVTNEAVELVDDKGVTKELLDKANVPVPKGKGFPADATDEEILTFGKSIGYPVVLKPTNASLGDGVVVNIMSDEELENALNYVRYELDYDEIIVEQHVFGQEYRIYVADNKAVAAYNRIPANITGDGVHTIKELIDLKNYERRQNARLNSCLIHYDVEIEEFLQRKNYDLTSVPPKGEYIPLREKTNVSAGGDPIDVTDIITDEMREIAINAVKAIPGLYHAGVDVIVNEEAEVPAVVLEINATAQIGGILFPLRGKARNIPAAIIDYYFPETKGMDTRDSQVYFDMSTVLEPMENRSALEVEVHSAPMGILYARRYIVTGNVDSESYHRWLKYQALDRGLHGHINQLMFDKIEIIVAGTDESVVDNFEYVIDQYTRGVKIRRIKAEHYNKHVTVGFDIIEMYNSTNMRSARRALRQMQKEKVRLERRRDRVAKDIYHIENSTSWKVTKPLRFFRKLFS